MAASPFTSSLPSGPLQFAPSAGGPSQPHTFSLRYPTSHPSDLSTAGASLSSTASGDVSLRMAGSSSGEPRARRWAGRQARPNGDVECAVVWDSKQNSWILHRIDNVVQLASDDPEPLPKKAMPIAPPPASKTVALALPKPARAPPPPPKVTLLDNKPAPSSDTRVQKEDDQRQLKAFNSSPPSAASLGSKLPSSVQSTTSQISTQPQHQSGIPATNYTSTVSTATDRIQVSDLAFPSKKSVTVSSSTKPCFQRPANHSTLPSVSSPAEQTLIPVAQADDVEEFDFVDSPPDPDPERTVSHPSVGPSPLSLPSPAPPLSHSTVGSGNLSRLNGPELAASPHGRATLSRSPSLADTNGASAGSPACRAQIHHALALPSRAPNRGSLPSPAYSSNAMQRSVVSSNQPTAPSPLQSAACSTGSSPAEVTQTAATPLLVSVSPASVTATTVDSTCALGGSSRSGPVASAQQGRPVTGSPVPTWNYTQHLQQPTKLGSPHGVNGIRSPAPLTNQNLGLANSQSSSSIPNRTYHRSDSGSSVRESDTDSEDEDESSEDEAQFEPVVTTAPQILPPPPPIIEAAKDSEEDAEAEEDDDEEEFELQNFATELEASMMIGDFCGPAMGNRTAYSASHHAEPAPPVDILPPPASKPKTKKKVANHNKTDSPRKASAAKSKSKGKAGKSNS